MVPHFFANIPASFTLFSAVGPLQAHDVQTPRVYQKAPESFKPSSGGLSPREQRPNPSLSPNPSWDPLLLFAAN